VLEALKEQYRIHPAIIQYLNSQKAQHYIDRNLQLKVGMDCYAFQFATQTDLQGMLEDRVRVLQEERFIIRSERIESFSSKRTNEQTNPETKEELRKKRLKALRQKGIS
jgi:hypothetical protein